MMRTVALLSLCAAASGANNDARNAKQASLPRSFGRQAPSINFQRALQEGEEAIFRATWGTDHSGSCVLAAVPVATLTCENDAEIALVDQTAESNCEITSTSEIECVGNIGAQFFSAEFSCAPVEGEFPGAVAALGEEEEDCLGGTPDVGNWVHGIQLFLMCEDEPQAIGICDPEESSGANNACSLGFTCAQGECTAETLTIPEISSTIENADCSITMAPTASLAPSGSPTRAETSAPTASPAPSDSPAPTGAPTGSPAPSLSPMPTVDAPDTTMPTVPVPAIPTSDITPTEPSPTSDGGSPTSDGGTEEPTSGSSTNKLTVISVMAATVIVLAGLF